MSALSRIRQNIGLIAIVIFIALAAFILTDFFRGISALVQGIPEAGTVAGQSIDDREYQEQASLFLQNAGGGQDDLQACQARTQAWNYLVQTKVLEEEYEDVGLEITGDELYDMFAGEEISPIVRQYLLAPGQAYDQNQVRRLLQQIQDNPEQEAQLRNLEDFAATQRAQERYLNMVAAGYLGSKASARRQALNAAKQVSFSYLAVNLNTIPDSTISVSDAQLRDYMEDHEDQYSQDASSVIRFARFALTPTRSDSNKYRELLVRRMENFTNVANDSTYTAGKTRTPYRGQNYLALSALPTEIRDSVFVREAKELVGPVQIGEYYKLFKVVGVEEAEESESSLKHILVTYKGDSTAALSRAREAYNKIRGGESFAAVAAEYSEDFRTKENGGVLGWTRSGQFGDDAQEAIDRTSVGSTVGPVAGPGGYHVFQVTDRTSNTYDLADIEEQISYSKATRDSVYGVANSFTAKVLGTGDINSVAAENPAINAFESQALTDQTCDILSLNGGREVVVWALAADEGEVSRKVFTVNDAFVVAQVIRKNEEGFQPLDLVREQVTRAYRKEQKGKQIQDKLAGLSGQDLNSMVSGYGPGAVINTAQNINFDTPSVPGIGNDRLVIGTALGLAQGETSKPIVGANGVYVIQVTAVTEPTEPAEGTILANQTNLASQGKLSLRGKIIQALVEIANVEDNRVEAEQLRYNFR